MQPDNSPADRLDLDTPEEIERFVRRFYDRLLEDPAMAPLFLEVAGVDLREHLPLIAAYWKKMLLGDEGYRRHTMARHRALHARHSLTAAHGRRWLAHFEQTLDRYYEGPLTERARRVARSVMKNLMAQVQRLPGGGTPAGQA